jgi:hypothetical protein
VVEEDKTREGQSRMMAHVAAAIKRVTSLS